MYQQNVVRIIKIMVKNYEVKHIIGGKKSLNFFPSITFKFQSKTPIKWSLSHTTSISLHIIYWENITLLSSFSTFMVLETESSVSCMVSMCSTTELPPALFFLFIQGGHQRIHYQFIKFSKRLR